MNKVAQKDLEWRERRSPKGKYGASGLDFGKPMDAGPGGHPFEMMLLRIPPGKRPWPYHAHAQQWEFYYVLEGSGEMRLEDGNVPFTEGDAMMCGPGEAHQIINNTDADLVVQIIASNHAFDACNYPDSGKWAMGGTIYRMDETTYYDGEE
mgnify:CR=1 FL=1